MMRRTWLHIVILLTALCVLPQGVCASRQWLDEEKWRSTVRNMDYTESFEYDETEEKKEKPPKPDSLKVILIVLGIAAILFIVSRFLRFGSPGANASTAGEAKVVTLEEAEENTPEADLESLLEQALARFDYRLALRVNFLMLVRLLAQTNKIVWAKEKTNWQYYREIKERLLADSFREIIIGFERYWYGDRPVDQRNYSDAAALYRNVRERLIK